MNWKVCDICGGKDMSGEGVRWTKINLGLILVGYIAFEDICPDCTKWLIETMSARINST